MARIETVSTDTASPPVKEALEGMKQMYGGVLPGIARILFVDPNVAGPLFQVYGRLGYNPEIDISPVQHEMMAILVNGLTGGDP